MGRPKTNLQIIKPSRRRPRGGDFFRMVLPDWVELYGRVGGADLEPPRAPIVNAYLIYVYKEDAFQSEEFGTAHASPGQLLLPPVFINRLPWWHGYFETIANHDLKESDLLTQHCFWSAARRSYVDEKRNPLPAAVEPCGAWGLCSYRWLDDQLSDALGIPRVPVE